MSSGRILGDVLCEGDYTTQLFWGYDFLRILKKYQSVWFLMDVKGGFERNLDTEKKPGAWSPPGMYKPL